MGEARIRQNAVSAAPCLCGSGKRAADCCYVSGSFRRSAAEIIFVGEGRNRSTEGCYLSHLGSCCEKLSREHLVSEAVLKVIKTQQLVVSGLPWQLDTNMKIGFSTLTSKCLCAAHNSALAPLDAAAAQFFDALRRASEDQPAPGMRVLISGHDVERWMLKTLCAMAYSSNLSKDGVRLHPRFDATIDIARLLADPKAWPVGSGLYFTYAVVGTEVSRENQFSMAPLTKPSTGEIVGMIASIQGLHFTLLAVAPESLQARLKGHRLGTICFKSADYSNLVELTWEDQQQHDVVTLEFSGTRAERLAAGVPAPLTLSDRVKAFR